MLKTQNFKWLIQNYRKWLRQLYEETISKTWITQYGIDGIISDNRLGVFSKKIPLYLSHQLQGDDRELLG
jgi:hypothetical protein